MFDTSKRLEGATGSLSKEGVIQWTVSYYCASINDIFTVNDSTYQGCEQVSRTWACNNDGDDPSYTVTIVYEGGAEDSKAEDGNLDDEMWSIDCEIREAPIISHWNFTKIQREYGGKWEDSNTMDNWIFDKILPESSSAKSGTGKNRSGADGVTNPLFGVTTYLVLIPTVSVSYTVKTLKSNIFSHIGKSYNNIPDAPQKFNDIDVATEGGNKTWMKLAPQVSKRGNVWTVTESYRLSEYHAWPKEVYPDGRL